ncbi:PEPxxWA-CTERM sorting domain-containing protein [Duganella aceris]|uniref:PEPxxWA-CTERM sorting domain-containing protein n=1 Tax=Duganella aceris TaxID=2703883 RepID=A0ABX0FHG7_9BURK|nr:PEPxxWA-CTERM sorting domain-containing protein [Duganella aceris]NGZ83997.1 PEPxxWA-CTERM sorting domain-containing protein [Duganella aceris]
MRIKSILLSISAVAALSAGMAHAATNLVVNGDFSQTTNGNNKELKTAKQVNDKRTMLTGWTSIDSDKNAGFNFVLDSSIANTKASVKWMKSDISGSLGSGNVFASDSQYHPGTLSQTITGLTDDSLYTLTFSYALAQQVGFTGANYDNYWQVGFGDTTQNTSLLTIDNGGFSGWKTATMTFAASGTSQVLSFLAKGTAPGAPPFLLLDNVSLTAAVPEPSTWAMMLGGFGLVGFLARRRRAATPA